MSDEKVRTEEFKLSGDELVAKVKELGEHFHIVGIKQPLLT